MVDREKPVVDSRDEGKHTGRNDLLSVEKTTQDGRASVTKDEGYNRLHGALSSKPAARCCSGR